MIGKKNSFASLFPSRSRFPDSTDCTDEVVSPAPIPPGGTFFFETNHQVIENIMDCPEADQTAQFWDRRIEELED